jgi:hypothetical protein
MPTSTRRGAMAVQAPHLFASANSGPRNLLHNDTVSRYALAASTVIHLQLRHATTTMTTVRMHELRGKLGIKSILGSFLSIFIYPDTVTRPLPLHTIKREGGTLDKTGWTTPSNGSVLSITQTLEHTHTHLGAIPLSTSLYPLLQALRCKATRAAASTESRANQYKLLCPPCTPSEAPTRSIIHLSRL